MDRQHHFPLSPMIAVAFSALVVSGLSHSVMAQPNTGIWDWNFTSASSGMEGHLYDEKNSSGKSGIPEKDLPYEFYIDPDNRRWNQVDRDEWQDYNHGDYSKYALLQLYNDLYIYGQEIPKGFYHIKIDTADGGSPTTQMHPQDTARLQPIAPEDFQEKKQVGFFRKRLNPKRARAMLLKRQGKVVAVLPITEQRDYERPKGSPKIKKPFVRLVHENGQMMLQYVDGGTVHISRFTDQRPIVFPLANAAPQGVSQGGQVQQGPPQNIPMAPVNRSPQTGGAPNVMGRSVNTPTQSRIQLSPWEQIFTSPAAQPLVQPMPPAAHQQGDSHPNQPSRHRIQPDTDPGLPPL